MCIVLLENNNLSRILIQIFKYMSRKHKEHQVQNKEFKLTNVKSLLKEKLQSSEQIIETKKWSFSRLLFKIINKNKNKNHYKKPIKALTIPF